MGNFTRHARLGAGLAALGALTIGCGQPKDPVAQIPGTKSRVMFNTQGDPTYHITYYRGITIVLKDAGKWECAVRTRNDGDKSDKLMGEREVDVLPGQEKLVELRFGNEESASFVKVDLKRTTPQGPRAYWARGLWGHSGKSASAGEGSNANGTSRFEVF